MSIKIISRGKGKSAVAAAAYRSGETIKNEYDGVTHSYTHKQGIVHAEIMLPQNAPSEYSERAVLWNAVEKCERYKTAQLAREIEISLPVELTQTQNIFLVQQFVQDNFIRHGMCADICVHNKDRDNPHAHIMLTMRPIEQDESWGQKSRTINGEKVPTVDWNEPYKAEDWRKEWASCVNKALKENGHNISIDHRSFKKQGVELEPTIHLGVIASRLEKRGIATDKGNYNRRIENFNRKLRQINARIKALEMGIKEILSEKDAPIIPHENQPTTPPPVPTPAKSLNLIEVLNGMIGSQETKNRWQKIVSLQSVASAVSFLKTHKITSLPQLHENATSLRSRFKDVNEKLKNAEQRNKLLTEHIKQAELFLEHREINRKYKSLKPKKQDAFFQANRGELTLFQAAERYLRQHLPVSKDGKRQLNILAWKKESAQLSVEIRQLYDKYYSLKEEVRQIEIVKTSVEHILDRVNEKPVDRATEMQRAAKRSHSLEQ
jgi:hypothetical protein